MHYALKALGLKKNYGGVNVVDGIQLEIKQGECVGILGPNGAGKSTTIKMIYGQVKPTEGELFVLGLNALAEIEEIRKRIGVVPQDDGLDSDFSAYENLKLFGLYHGMEPTQIESQAETLLAEMRLTEFQHKPVESLSGGMKRRLAIARALIHNPQLLLMDEPTTGLDPQARLWIWNYFEKLKALKHTLILTTHYMEEAERLCDRIIIIDHGKVLDAGTSAELINKHIGKDVIELHVKNEKEYWKGKVSELQLKYQEYEDSLFVFINEIEQKNQLINFLQNTQYYVRSANLNDVFLKLAGYQIRESH